MERLPRCEVQRRRRRSRRPLQQKRAEGDPDLLPWASLPTLCPQGAYQQFGSNLTPHYNTFDCIVGRTAVSASHRHVKALMKMSCKRTGE